MTLPSETAIRVANLSKVFKIYHRPADMIWEILTGRPRHKPHWVLKDISFEIQRGQVVGLIGQNGAGKSTLLKIITGTLDKTSGQLEVNGRISSILELGTGFNLEYSGRENIYLGGLMVGLSHEEIKAKEDWIIEFSELKDYIDQPFKTYSTGMRARLTFATAVCVDPDILIIDEALSVGDARFQRKSFGKIEEFRNAGRTIFLVSHDINTITAFCDSAILLNNGSVQEIGAPYQISKIYYKQLFSNDRQNVQSIEPTRTESAAEDDLSMPEIKIARGKMKKGREHSWIADLSEYRVQGDSIEHPAISQYILFENDHKLKPGHSAHEAIRQSGRGAYSHWGDELIFSTSDNSDPRKNGRSYTLKYVIPPSLKEIQNSKVEDPEHARMRLLALKKFGVENLKVNDNERIMRMGNGKAEILDYGILDQQGERVTMLSSGAKYTLFFNIVYYEDVESATVAFVIKDIRGLDMFGISTKSAGMKIPNRKKGDMIEAKVDATMWLTNGVYFLTVLSRDLFAEDDVYHDAVFDGFQFEVPRKQDIFDASIVDLDAKLIVKKV